MHLLLAHYFGRPGPRWADEGAAIVSEGESERSSHRKAFVGILEAKRQFPLRELLKASVYPSDIPSFYAQSHSVSGFLVDAKGHPAFLTFLRTGMERGWDQAARAQYGYQDVEQLERAWLDSLPRESRPAE